MISRRQVFRTAARAAALAAMTPRARADSYPSRPIRLVIPYAAGGSGDQIGRPWAKRMDALLGPVFVENIAGAGGALGCAAVAREAGDGYSLLLGNTSTHVFIPLASTHPPYDAARDFRPICRLITSALVFAVHPLLPVQNLAELVAYARANPGKLSYGSSGVGTGNHLVGEMFKQQAGAADIVHVPYRGSSLALNDLMGGQIPLVVAVMSSQLLELNRAGRLRIIAVTSEKRLAGAADFPTVAEAGMPDLRYDGWFGLFAPRATDDAVLERIVQATRRAMADPALQETYRSQGMEPDTDPTAEKLATLIEDELVRFASIVKSMGLKHD